MKKLEVIFVNDQDSYESVWMNGKRCAYATSDLTTTDMLRMIEKFSNENDGIESMEVHDFEMYEAHVSQIPDDVNTVEGLQKWYLEETGEELE